MSVEEPLGIRRETMLNNQLLMRPGLGQQLTRGMKLPGSYFTYGKPNDDRNGGASEAITWLSMAQKAGAQRPGAPKSSDRDFLALNKSAVGAGLVTAPEQYQYRATHDIRRRASNAEKMKSRRTRLPPSMTFGISTRPCTPVFELLEHKYQDRWLQMRRQAELARREKTQQKNLTTKGVYDTRTSLLRKYQPDVDPPPLWQMPRFTRSASPHLETFRKKEARKVAFQHNDYDSIARKGVFGQGIYESAKN